MKRMHQLLGGMMGVAAITLAGVAVAAEPPHVAEVIHFSEADNPAKVEALTKKALGLMQKIGCGCTVRVWDRAFGGDAGETIVIEFPSMLALAQYGEKTRNSPEWAAFFANDVIPSGTKPPSIELVVERIL